jgi:nitrite reductase/ring-hydroxylating ferredoxin subunit
MAMQEWQVGSLAEIDEPGAMEFRVGDVDWPFRGIVVRWQGEVHAYANVCAHLGHPLNLDADKFFTAEQTLLVCASHGAVFEPDTGKCVGGPCAGASLRSLECRVDGGEIFVTAPASQRS